MKAQLTIMLDDNGTVNVNGPVGDKMLCYALLECGRDAINDFHKKQANGKQVLPAGALALDQLKGN